MLDQTYNLNEILARTEWSRTRRLVIDRLEALQDSPFPDDRGSIEALAILRSKRQEFTMREIKIVIGNMALRDACHALTWVTGELHHGVPYAGDDIEIWEGWLSHDGWDLPPR